jgi:symplekin
MDSFPQTSLQNLITPLVRTLGPKHPKILDLVQNCPPGADPLILRVINILTEKGRAASPLVALIKSMAHERDLSPRFLVPVITEFDKVSSIFLMWRWMGSAGN